MGPVLLLGQFFGMLPVDGVLSESENDLKFRWKSPKTIYSMIFLFCGTVESCLATRRLLRLGFNIHFAETLLFFVTATIHAYIFFHLGRKWKDIMNFWRSKEEVFLNEPYKSHKFELKKKICIFYGIAAFMAIRKIYFIGNFNFNLIVISF